VDGADGGAVDLVRLALDPAKIGVMGGICGLCQHGAEDLGRIHCAGSLHSKGGHECVIPRHQHAEELEDHAFAPGVT
jgi:hypothetical protein